MTELLPCPFCGKSCATVTNTKEMERPSTCFMYTVVCDATQDGCGVTCGYEFDKADAITAWNTRHGAGDAEELSVRIGNYGAAFDTPGTRRAFTYKHQPGNVDASRLARAFQSTACESAGDSIDRGLLLLRELEAMGFGVFQLGDAARAGERGVA